LAPDGAFRGWSGELVDFGSKGDAVGV